MDNATVSKGVIEEKILQIKDSSDGDIKKILKDNGIGLSIYEARKVADLIRRNPTLTELHIFNNQWNEHVSYKSSRSILKKYMPVEGPTVMLGVGEDSGIIYLTTINGERYGIVIGHESHNHPSQVVPYEGAATGIGGIVRDVLCMGAKVIAVADPLRFGNPDGKNKEKVRYIANAVIDGIAGYGNPIGVPNIAGDVYMNDSFDDNCLVNVVCLGLIKEADIIHSRAPENSEGYDIIVVGKATDNSGFGGAAFSSLILDEKERDSNRGAVQVPDPFLKNIIMRATYAVFDEAKKSKVSVGFKDMGAGGIVCSTSEICSAGGYGAEIDLDKVHVSLRDLPPYIIGCSETQERFTWISPREFTKKILKIYNEDFELPNISEGARASIVGKVTSKKDYVLKHKGKIVCNLDIDDLTEGIKYERAVKEPKANFSEPIIDEPKNADEYKSAILKVLSNPNVASKAKAFKHYDSEVQGNTVIRPGEADAGVIAPISGNPVGVALAVDCNPMYCRINPYLGGINAVAECMRNVSAVGAVPYGMTDCLNYGNPEIPEHFFAYVEGVKGISDAAKNLWMKGSKNPVPFVSGNVSLYNQSSSGKVIDQSPIIACVGVLDDYSKAITMKIKSAGSVLFLVGERKDELGGSAYYQTLNQVGKNIPQIDFENERGMIYSVIDAISERLLLSCHDISDGGLIAGVSEMILGGNADGEIGAEIDIGFSRMRADKVLFSESSGFVVEVSEKNIPELKKIFSRYKIGLIPLGKTVQDKVLRISNNSKKIADIKIPELKDAWWNGFSKSME